MMKPDKIPKLQSKSHDSLWKRAFNRFFKNRMAVFGLGITAFLVLVGLTAPLISPYDPMLMDLVNSYGEPDAKHIFGLDELGRDVFSRIIHGTRYDLGLTFITVFLAAVAGVGLGTIAGYRGGFPDTLIMRSADILLAFPVFLLGLMLVAFLGPSMLNVILALMITRLPRYARLIRGVVLQTKEMEYIQAAIAIGVKDLRIIGTHILPNSIASIIIFATLDMGITITALAGLSFLGVGIQPPTPEWGLMLSNARNNMFSAPWTAIFPGIAISITTIGFNFLGDGLRDALDPRTR